jgi:hypothetical protein
MTDMRRVRLAKIELKKNSVILKLNNQIAYFHV